MTDIQCPSRPFGLVRSSLTQEEINKALGYTLYIKSYQLPLFKPIALALVRRTFPELFANKITGIQPMAAPVGLAYALRHVYNDDDVLNDKGFRVDNL
jgi:hypothetical protein